MKEGNNMKNESENEEEVTQPLYSRHSFDKKNRSPLNVFPTDPMNPETAYHIVHDYAMLDGNARLNLATFGTTWMDDYANKLYSESYDKNMVDKDEYPETAKIETKCWKMLANLWHAEDPDNTIGCSAVGSSEACMLGALALKRRWVEKRRAEGKSVDKPNLVISAAEQVVWLKYANYFDVELRTVPISWDHKVLDGYKLEDYIDENTIGVIAILGVTYTGMLEPVEKISEALDRIQEKTGLDIPIHVDAATGGLFVPFVNPDLKWDFRIKRVASINVSGHKYGLVYQSVGWTVWRSADMLPKSLVFNVSYLGGSMPTFTLNFSKPGAQILLQYYNFLRYGFEGYKAIQESSLNVAQHLAKEIAKMGPFELWNDASEVPVFAWMLKKDEKRKWTLYDLADRLRMKGWQVPAYPMPESLTEVTVQRVVVRYGLSMDLANELLEDIQKQVDYLNEHNVTSSTVETAFHH